ncbi:UNKNOWN [Stylonychia lemnae]|uniref:Iq calmodulin-binding motif family protein n=1 Tax=Stylonychia lemnae TaxID=5949 RepID=A0A078B095_STYLE|nr:UNKNOWN [Stylonychia lemnae]|eukprot:CDW86827.1 UNKNOWN [Stylonychia lemnae]
MKSNSQAKLQQPNSISTTTSVNSKQIVSRDWAEKVQSDQILQILNTDSAKNSDNLNTSSTNGSMFQQFNDKQRIIQPAKAPRINSQGSSRSSAYTVNSNLNKTGNQSINLNSDQISPRSQAKRDIQVFQQQLNQKGSSNISNCNIPRSSTQENKRRRSVRQQQLHNQSDLPELARAKIQSSFNSNKNQGQHMQSPSEKIISSNPHKIKRRMLGGEGSSTDRLFNQIVKTQDDKQEMNKENVIEDNKITSNSTKSLMMIQYHNQNPQKAPTSQSSRLPMKLQKSFTYSQQNGDNISSRTSVASQLPSNSMMLGSQQNTILEKQMKEVNKQKELLQKLQREKDELEKQMQNNEKAIQNRMQKLHQERRLMEEKIIKASIVIQRFARGFIARLRFKNLQDNQIIEQKAKLANVLDELKVQINTCFNQVSDQVNDQIDASATMIQRAARKMIARKNFRISLYKLMLFKNIVENKVHKEKMQMLYAFEQLIINTEDENDEEYYDEVYGQEDYEGDEYAAGVGGGYPHLSRQFPPAQRVPVEAEYLSNPSDIIDEEEYEDSEEEKEHHQKMQIEQNKQIEKPQTAQVQGGGKILNKVTANDLLEFARKNSAGLGDKNQTLQSDDHSNQFEIEVGAGMFGQSKNSNYGEYSQQSQLSTLNAKKRSSSEKRETDSQKNDSLMQSELPKAVSRRIQPRQQQAKPKMLALPPPELTIQKQPPRPIDMERINALSQPKTVPEEEVLPPPKKKAPKPPMAQKPKKKKSKKNQEISEALVLAKPQKKRRRVSRQGSGQQVVGDLISNYEKLLKHRESRTSIKMQRQNSHQDNQVYAIEYKADDAQNDKYRQQQRNAVRLPLQLTQKQAGKNQQSQAIGVDYQRNQKLQELGYTNEPSLSSNQDLAEIDTQNNLQIEHKIPQVIQKQDYLEDSQDLTIVTESQNVTDPRLGLILPPIQSNIQQNLSYQQQIQMQSNNIPNYNSQQNLQANTNQQTQQSQQQHQHQQHQADPSQLYKKCFPHTSLGFKERFPVFADILQRYNKNLKHISNAAAVTATNTVIAKK